MFKSPSVTIRGSGIHGAWLESKISEGGTSLARVREQIERAREVLAE